MKILRRNLLQPLSGETNLFEGYVSNVKDQAVTVVVESGQISGVGEGFDLNEMLAVSVRPERMKYSIEPVDGFTLAAKVKEQVYVGSVLKTIAVLPNGNEIKIERLAGQVLRDGDLSLLGSTGCQTDSYVGSYILPGR